MMMEESLLRHDVDLRPYLTFGIAAKARLFAEYTSLKELVRISRMPAFRDNQLFHIGGGSNLLFFDTFDGLVLHSGIKGITEYSKNENEHFVIAGAGEQWKDLVDWCVDHGYSGMECMAGIPGELGAAPVQNVGAFGAEAKDVIFSVECFDTEKKETVKFLNEECGFGYRTSRFKEDWKNRYFVLRVSFKLRKSDKAENLSYAPISEFAERLGHTPTVREVRDEVIRLRRLRLPEISEMGSAGSFFKNPIIHKNFYSDEVLRRCPDVPSYEVDYRRVKIPAGWLIEKSGMKGVSVGGAEVYPKNCLVIANKGNATANDVKSLADMVQQRVNEKFALRLEPEVNYVDTSIEVVVLGTGTSKGVPEIGCDCYVCKSEDPKDKRLRSSILVKTMGLQILIDASPDFRYQALRNKIYNIDALLLTHIHYDHVGGIDDLRPFCLNNDIPVYCRSDVDEDLRRRIDYCFRDNKYPGVPAFDTHIISDSPFLVKGVKVIPVSVNHGNMPIVGFRIGNFAYITDCKTISDGEKDKLEGLDVLIVNALRDRDHFAHFTIEEALDLISQIKPRRAYLTHFCHEAGKHSELLSRLPQGVEPAYDGQVIHI